MSVYRNPLVRSLHVFGSIAILLLTVVVGLLLLRHSGREAAIEAHHAVAATAGEVARVVNQGLEARRRRMAEVARNPALSIGESGTAPEAGVIMEGALAGELEAFGLSTTQGTVVLRLGNPAATLPADREWWVAALDREATTELVPDSAGGVAVVRLAVPVRRQPDEPPGGVLAGVVTLGNVLGPAVGAADQQIHVVGPGGQVLWRWGSVAGAAPGALQTAGGLAEAAPLAEAPLELAGHSVQVRAVSIASPWNVGVVLEIAWFALTALGILYLTTRWLEARVILPLQVAQEITMRVSTGDLRVRHEEVDRVGGGPFTDALRSMVGSLTKLVGGIRMAASESAALAQQISASTQQMTASTEEVAGTTSDLTERASAQAQLVREVAEDASRILAIAQELAAGALQTAERNASLVRLARGQTEQLAESTAALATLGEEIERGAEEGEALERATEEIGNFLIQAKAIARQTHMLALNASIEAARAGAEGRGFSVVADEVRKLAGQAARAATTTGESVDAIVAQVQRARERLLRLGEGGVAARRAFKQAMEGLGTVTEEAEANDAWTRGISRSADEVRTLVQSIAGRTREISAATEDYAAAAEEIAAAAQELNASTEEIAGGAGQLADAAVRLTDAVGSFNLAGSTSTWQVSPPAAGPRTTAVGQPVPDTGGG